MKTQSNPISGNEIYLLSLPSRQSVADRAIAACRLIFPVALFTALAVSPSLATSFNFTLAAIALIAVAMEMALKAVLFVEVVGYVYHRFFQHLGLSTRLSSIFRRNQRFHWNHHNVRYPTGKFYKRPVKYTASEKGSWAWIIPGLMLVACYLFFYGLSTASIVFVTATAAYTKFVVSNVHEHFHEGLYYEKSNSYFRWLDQIHLLHHFDQRRNFTIVHPLMDMICGTYRNPKHYSNELAMAVCEEQALVSDLINWAYMLTEANPTEYAQSVSQVHKHSRLRKKLALVITVLQERLAACPEDKRAALLAQRAQTLYDSAQPATTK